ncbi:hypothetical protein [Streptomyces sp. NPDC018967]|uniref:hypothetical protein n=1 Tax=Streptomyces sp. NPDC018967 TaxID=3365059 RepID=UPI0037A709A8
MTTPQAGAGRRPDPDSRCFPLAVMRTPSVPGDGNQHGAGHPGASVEPHHGPVHTHPATAIRGPTPGSPPTRSSSTWRASGDGAGLPGPERVPPGHALITEGVRWAA